MTVTRPLLADTRRFLALVLLATLGLAVWLGVQSVAARVRLEAAAAASTLLVRITAPDGPDTLNDAAARLRSLPEVAAAAPLSPGRVKAMLEGAGGDAIDPSTLPATRLVEVRTRPGPENDVHIGRALRAAGFEAEIFAAASDMDHARAQAGAIEALGLAAAIATAAVIFLLAAAAAGACPHPGVAIETGFPRRTLLEAFGREGAALGFRAGLAATALCAVGAPLVLAALGAPISLDRLFPDAPGMLTPTEAASGLLAPLVLSALCARAARAGAAAAFDRADLLG